MKVLVLDSTEQKLLSTALCCYYVSCECFERSSERTSEYLNMISNLEKRISDD